MVEYNRRDYVLKKVAARSTSAYKQPDGNKYHLKSRFGINVEQYNAMLAAQNGVCAICKQPQRSESKKRLGVDHDHKTGRIRSLLCVQCNSALGMIEDRKDRLFEILAYLHKWSGAEPEPFTFVA